LAPETSGAPTLTPSPVPTRSTSSSETVLPTSAGQRLDPHLLAGFDAILLPAAADDCVHWICS
jgi:hypothetical protein